MKDNEKEKKKMDGGNFLKIVCAIFLIWLMVSPIIALIIMAIRMAFMN